MVDLAKPCAAMASARDRYSTRLSKPTWKHPRDQAVLIDRESGVDDVMAVILAFFYDYLELTPLGPCAGIRGGVVLSTRSRTPRQKAVSHHSC